MLTRSTIDSILPCSISIQSEYIPILRIDKSQYEVLSDKNISAIRKWHTDDKESTEWLAGVFDVSEYRIKEIISDKTKCKSAIKNETPFDSRHLKTCTGKTSPSQPLIIEPESEYMKRGVYRGRKALEKYKLEYIKLHLGKKSDREIAKHVELSSGTILNMRRSRDVSPFRRRRPTKVDSQIARELEVSPSTIWRNKIENHIPTFRK